MKCKIKDQNGHKYISALLAITKEANPRVLVFDYDHTALIWINTYENHDFKHKSICPFFTYEQIKWDVKKLKDPNGETIETSIRELVYPYINDFHCPQLPKKIFQECRRLSINYDDDTWEYILDEEDVDKLNLFLQKLDDRVLYRITCDNLNLKDASLTIDIFGGQNVQLVFESDIELNYMKHQSFSDLMVYFDPDQKLVMEDCDHFSKEKNEMNKQLFKGRTLKWTIGGI